MGQKIRLWSNESVHEVEGLGYQSPKPIPCDELSAGEVGFLFANIKTVSDAQIGDTIMDQRQSRGGAAARVSSRSKPMVFAGLYPVESHEHGLLRDALEKLRLNDSAFNFEPENSVALGFGFRCGFPGPAASGDRAGAAGARVQDRSDHHRAGRPLQSHHS